LVLDYLVGKQRFRVICEVELVSNETVILASEGSLDISVGVAEGDPSRVSAT
jgi:hypothetical protein